MPTLSQDLRLALRLIRKNPAFAGVIVAVLAVGIGANAAIFSLADAALVKPLPFPAPDELVMLWEHPPGYAYNRVSPLNFVDWSEQNAVFRSMAAVAGGSRTLVTSSGPERIPGQAVTGALFEMLGVRPVAGRTFAAKDSAERAKVVVISEGLWRSRFGGDAAIVGRSIRLDDDAYTVIGVAPAGFQVLYKSDLWTLYVPRRSPEQRRMHYLQVLARLRPGVGLERASAGMAVVAAGIARTSPETNRNWGVTVEPLRQALVGRTLRITALVLAAVVGFILLLACANVANLLLVRAAGRTREIAVRASLGGSRWRIARQLLTESGVLAVFGGAAGIALASAILRAAPSFLPAGFLPVALHLAIDARVVGFTLALVVVTTLLFGLAPAWQAARRPLAESLRAGVRVATGGTGTLRSALAICQIAIAVMLSAGAGLLVRTVASLGAVDPGYHAADVLTAYVTLPVARYRTPDTHLAFFQAVERELRSMPGVRAAAVGGNLPLDGWDIGQGFEIVGQPSKGEANQPAAHYQMVSASYLDTLGIRLLRGRGFDDHDIASTTQVCLVNEEFVRRHLGGQDPIGTLVRVQAMDPAGPKPVVRQIVGVVAQVKVEGLGEKENAVEIYVPITQNVWDRASLAVRAGGDPASLVPALKAAVARIDKDLPLTNVRTMDEVAAESISEPRFRARLLAAFAAVAVALAAIGVFGVLAFSVGQRAREFGIRMALGADAPGIVRLVLSGGVKIIVAGLAAGLGAAALLTRFLGSLLFGVKPLDPLTFVAAGGLLALTALGACAVPALRAARVEPTVTLRQE
jgi:predicted permease